MLLNFDRSIVSGNSFKVYQGHHGDLNAPYANVIFPSTSFIEKNAFYSNLLGIVQKTKKVLFSPGNSRDD
jgi:NADH dehydrogenase/NADH:ubiquinone oxidoreductase subunit G